jgi:hypothetical protein
MRLDTNGKKGDCSDLVVHRMIVFNTSLRITYWAVYLAISPLPPALVTENIQAHVDLYTLYHHIHHIRPLQITFHTSPSTHFSSSSNNPRIFPLSLQESLCHTRKLRLRLLNLIVLSSRQEYRTGILATNPPHRRCVLRVLFRLVFGHYFEAKVLLRAPDNLAVGL